MKNLWVEAVKAGVEVELGDCEYTDTRTPPTNHQDTTPNRDANETLLRYTLCAIHRDTTDLL